MEDLENGLYIYFIFISFSLLFFSPRFFLTRITSLTGASDAEDDGPEFADEDIDKVVVLLESQAGDEGAAPGTTPSAVRKIEIEGK